MHDVPWIWMNGALRPAAEAVVPLGTHALHYGTGVFEGVRAYETSRGPGAFRLRDHLQRLVRSGRFFQMELPWSVDELVAAVWETIEANELRECYIRPVAWRGYHQLGIYPLDCPVEVGIMVWPWGTYHGNEGLERGVTAMIASTRRFDANVLPPQAKANGQYLNSILAKLEADRAGCDEAIMLNQHGRVAEASAENIFVVRDGVVYTPPLSESILGGITRDTVLQMCGALGIRAIEQPMDRQDLYLADEVFLTGTAAEVTPVREIDGRQLAGRGPVTAVIQERYLATVHGADTPWAHFVEYGPSAGEGATLSEETASV